MGGSLSGEKRVQPPQFVEDAQRDAIMRAMEAADLGYVPYQGPTVAALSPMQVAAMNAASDNARAFGYDAPTDVLSGMPETTTMGGVTGYSPYPIYIEALERLKQTAPAQYEYIMGRKMNPQTGQMPVNRAVQQPVQPVATGGGGGGGVDLPPPQPSGDLGQWLSDKLRRFKTVNLGMPTDVLPPSEFDANKGNGSWKKGGPF